MVPFRRRAVARRLPVERWSSTKSLPVLPGALELLALDFRSTAHPENEKARRGIIVRDDAATSARFHLLFDPQTCGGLVFGVPGDRADEAVERLRQSGCRGAARIGTTMNPREDGALIEVVAI